MAQVEKKIVDGKVAVLVSPGFGAGWSTWSSAFGDFLVFDKGLVELAERGAPAEEAEARVKEVFGEDAYVYMGGWSNVEIRWLPEGHRFYIHEYDGSESVVDADNLVMQA